MTMVEYSRIQVSELVASGEVELKTGPFGTQLKASEYTERGTPVINVRNIGFGGIKADKLEFISPVTRDRLSSHVLRRGDIVFGRKGAVERHVFIRQEQDGWFQGSDCLRLRFVSKRVEPLFASYYFLTADHQRWMMNQCSHGATMASLNQEILERIELPLPLLSVQRRIVSVLSAYDELIENNQRRIRILEEVARALYREWFVHFRFPSCKARCQIPRTPSDIPEGWDAIPFEDLLVSMTGGDWGSEQPNEVDSAEVSIVRGTDFEEVAYGANLRVPVRYIRPSSFKSRGLKIGDVIVENSINAKSRCVGTPLLVDVHLLGRLGRDAVAASFCKVFRFRDASLAAVACLHFRHLREQKRMEYYQNVAANGIGNFQAQKFVREEQLVVPRDPKVRAKLVDKITSLASGVSLLASQIQNLRRTRDLLLPRLLSGQVELEVE